MSSTRNLRKSVLCMAMGVCLSSIVAGPVLAQSVTGAASDERHRPIAMQRTDLRKLRVLLLMVSPRVVLMVVVWLRSRSPTG